MPDWYAVQVKQHCEQRVLQGLVLGHIPAFLPLIEVIRRHGAGRYATFEPLFPAYLFAQLEERALDPGGWGMVRWMPGVRRILGSSESPIPVPPLVIEALQERVRPLGFVRPDVSFVPGSRVAIRQGPLKGLEAVFDRPMNRSGRVRVLLQLLGHPRGLEVDALDLEPV